MFLGICEEMSFSFHVGLSSILTQGNPAGLCIDQPISGLVVNGILATVQLSHGPGSVTKVLSPPSLKPTHSMQGIQLWGVLGNRLQLC